VGNRTAKARLGVADITAVERVARTFVTTAAGLGVTVSLEKTKMMAISYPETGDMPKELKNGIIAAVDNFAYLGSNISNDGKILNEMSARLQKHLDACDLKCVLS